MILDTDGSFCLLGKSILTNIHLGGSWVYSASYQYLKWFYQVEDAYSLTYNHVAAEKQNVSGQHSYCRKLPSPALGLQNKGCISKLLGAGTQLRLPPTMPYPWCLGSSPKASSSFVLLTQLFL